MTKPSPFNLKVFGAPLVLAAFSLIGLVAALVGDGAYDAVSWIGLGAPVVVTAWALAARRR